jgi:DNA-directed RNA polymerase subunit RPC12/RpoP
MTPEEWKATHHGEQVTEESKHGCPEIICMECGSRAFIKAGKVYTIDDGDGFCDQSYLHHHG